MSKVYADAVATSEPTDDLTLGAAGDNVIIPAGATLRTNTLKDAGGNTIFTSNGSGTLSSVRAGLSGGMVLLATNTFTNATSSSFATLIDDTYKLYIFRYYNINPDSSGNDAQLLFQANPAASITSTYFEADHPVNDAFTDLQYVSSASQAESTSGQRTSGAIANAAASVTSGELYVFNPSSTVYTKMWYGTGEFYYGSLANRVNTYFGGFFDTTDAITEITFTISVGNFDGTIKMYGVG